MTGSERDLVLVALGLLLVAVLVAGLFGLVPLAFRVRPARTTSVLGGPLPSATLAVAGVIVIVALAVGAIAGLGLVGGSNDEPSSVGDVVPSATTRATPSSDPAPATTVTTAPAASSDSGGAARGPVVRLRADEPDEAGFPSSYEGVDGLQPSSVLRLEVEGFDDFAEARARQCVTVTRTVCRNEIAVQFGSDGSASFQYLVVDDFAPAEEEECRAGTAPCSIVVESVDGEDRVEVATLFHGELPPPGRIRVTPSRGVTDGQAVLVEVENYPPGAGVQAMLGAAPAATGTERCGAPAPTAAMIIGPDGTASARLVIRSGPVGRVGVMCGSGRTCGVSVASDTVFTRAPVVRISWAAQPGADYGPTRLAAGISAAVVLLTFATWLVRRTDWSPIGEAAAPEIDDAAYADLDAIIAALPPEDDREDASARSRRE